MEQLQGHMKSMEHKDHLHLELVTTKYKNILELSSR